MNPKIVDLNIVGGGPVGLFAAFYAGLRGMSVRIIDSLPELGGQLVALYPEKYVYDVPGFPKILAKDLAKEMVLQGTQFEADLVLEDTAETLDRTPDSYIIGTRNGLKLPSRAVMISAGAGAFTPTKLGVEREAEFENMGLFYGVLDKSVFTGKRLVIVGGGDSAFDWVINLEPIASHIVLVHRRDVFKAHEDSVNRVKQSSVVMRLFRTVKELHGEALLTGVTLENTQTKELEYLEADAIIVNVGFKSNLGPIKNWGLNIERNLILVDRCFQTNLPGVFSIGDVCNFDGKLKLIATGTGEAATAVCFAKMWLDPEAKLFPGHSSEMDLQFPSSTPAP